MNVKTRALTALSTGVLLFGLVACGGSDSGESPAGASNAQASQGAPAPATGGEKDTGGDDAGDPVETPLTGEAKQKTEAAALAAFPGTVVKSEEDKENPGLYAVEIKKADGTEVEVYLDPKTFEVVKTKDEDGS
ncbi:PepSY domain-containing protein [Streptomyces sp. NPDC059255]|uniref:PepSY domain-containing protein n=1 Tax=Streptomyces sp. NPDC059255 TaxID=3346793 RepID=UPI0036C6CAB8